MTGKSALLGVLVCAAHPGLRARAPGLWWRLRHTPAANDRLAVVHARRRSLTEIAESLARQMGGDVSRSAKGWGVEQLLALAQDGAARPFTLVVDALDEAERPSDVVFALLMPLLNARTLDGWPVVRLLVGARREPGFAPLLEAARKAGGLIDLDVADSDGVRASLRHYIGDLLAVDTPYAVVDGAAVGAAFAESLADELMPARQPDGRQPLGWGEFLVAGMYVRHVLDSPVVTDTNDARRVAREVPRYLPGLLDLELRRPGSHPWLGPVLTALAWAEGMGMPERIVAHVAGVFGTGVGPAPLEGVREALDAGRFFLRQAVETDGNTLYRLFHEGLAEHLRARPRQGGPQQAQAAATSTHPAAVVLRSLLDSGPASPDGGRVWEAADPYALRHAAGHALASDSVDSLLNDMEFLAHGDPASVDAVLSSARSDWARLVAAVYRASYEVHRPLTAYQRRQILAVDAARHAEPAMGERLARPSGWAPVWATGRGVALALLNTLHDASGRLTGVASASVNGRPAAVTASWDETAKVWDLTTGLAVSTLIGHTDRLSATAVAAVAGRPLAVTASADGTVRVWDAMGGEQITVITHDRTRVTDVAITELDSRAILVTADNRGTARVWDAETGERLGALRGHNGALSSVAVDRLRGDPVTLTTGWDRTARIWDLRSGSEVAVLRGHRNMVTGAALTDFDGRAIAVTSSWDTTARVWDVATGKAFATLRGHSGALTGVAVQRVGRRLTAVTVGGDSDRTVRIWDLGTRSPVRAATGHTDTVTIVALAREDQPPVVVTAGEDHTACVWDARTKRQVAQMRGHTAAVTAVALVRSGDRLLTVTGSADRTARIWDTASGAAVAVLPDRGSAVTGVATGTLDGHPIIAVTTGSPHSVAVVWDVSDLEAAEKLCEYTGHRAAITAVVLTRIGTHAVAVTSDEAGTSHVWYVASGRLIQVLHGRRGAVSAAAGARLGGRDLVVTACRNHTAYVWDLSSGHCVRTLGGHTAPLTDVTTVTLDGLLLAITAAEDRTVRVHDLASGRPLTTISLPAMCASVTAAPDGTVVLAIGQDVIVITLENWRSV
ncbi:WD40 repeat domain-containing protein [Streptomyces mirabilis]|uniref:WD40 repeat domain-containing protein n=1 Tax=Streptomyces mirabilis TaxID=68239 RepID=UPI0036D9697D